MKQPLHLLITYTLIISLHYAKLIPLFLYSIQVLSTCETVQLNCVTSFIWHSLEQFFPPKPCNSFCISWGELLDVQEVLNVPLLLSDGWNLSGARQPAAAVKEVVVWRAKRGETQLVKPRGAAESGLTVWMTLLTIFLTPPSSTDYPLSASLTPP